MTTKQKILTGVMVTTVILFLSGLAYAYFITTVEGEGQEVNVTTAELKSSFTDGPQIDATNIEPGWTTEKEISIENTGSDTITYKLEWANLTNEFIHKNDLVYKFEAVDDSVCPFTNNGNSSPIPDSGSNIEVGTAALNAGEIHKCKVVFEYIETNTDQSSDMAKNFNGKFAVVDASK